VARRSPLHRLHEALGARFTMFGDWEMPLQYEGTMAEHTAVRTAVGVFDVSHLGRFTLSGQGSADLIDRLLCNDIGKALPGRTQYTMMLTDDGGVLDDIIVWRLADERFVVLPNGVNHDRVLARFVEAAPEAVTIDDLRDDTAMLAVQGPEAPALLADIVGEAPRRSRVVEGQGGVTVAGTGYTGEAGGEVIVPVEDASVVAGSLFEAARPCGLGARDTLRLEMGYPLWGQDIDETISPLEAGLGWAIGWDRDFVGREALSRQRADGLRRRRVGFVLEGRRPPRHGYPLRGAGSTGEVTSGNFSPTLGAGIGMGYLSPPPQGTGGAVEVDIRGTWVPGVLTEPPFVRAA
jgi:glycine cleavage system T protein